MMHPRNILIFMDGTGNSSGKLFRTNVWRLYKAVDLADPEDPFNPRQFAYYHDGVGTSSFKPYAIIGGAFGAGLARSIRDSYAFVCRTYREGDRIYVFGFSRGAFAARLLAALILDQGLIRYKGSEAELTRLAAAAYRRFRRRCFVRFLQVHVHLIRWLRDWLIERYERCMAGAGYRPYTPDKNIHHAKGEPLKVEFVGVWDTVSAYGLPVDELTRAVDIFIWPLSMPDHDLNPNVRRAMHALALDDERNTFHPELWNEGTPAPPNTGPAPQWLRKWVADFLEKPDLCNPPTEAKPRSETRVSRVRDERISQVWFAGVHSDVGGGYPDEGLSYVALEWIMTGAKRAGVRFCEEIWDQYRALSDENGPIHDSRQGLGGYYRYNPRRIERLTDTHDVQIARTKIHQSVFRRISVGQDGYAPIALPPDFDVVLIDGTIKPGTEYLGQGTPLGPKSFFANQREHVFNWVWWRRIAYFFTLFMTLALAAMPLTNPALQKGVCDSSLCFVSEWVSAVALVLPAFAATWTDTFASHPKNFLLLACAIAAGLFAGAWCDRRIRDGMRSLWYTIKATTPDNPDQSYTGPEAPGTVNSFVEWLRTRDRYRDTLWAATHWVLPTVFILLVGYGTSALFVRLVFSFEDSAGFVCPESKGTKRDPALTPVTVPFRTNALCAGTGVTLKKGGSYHLTFTIPAHTPWCDGKWVSAGPNGVPPNSVSWLMTAALPLRRRLAQPWFKPMARIGHTGTDDYPLQPVPSLPEQQSQSTRRIECSKRPSSVVTFSSDLVARSEGELFLYVNDAILAPFWKAHFYQDNEGTALVRISLNRDASLRSATGGNADAVNGSAETTSRPGPAIGPPR